MAVKGFLKTVLDLKRQEIEKLKKLTPQAAVREKAEHQASTSGSDFFDALSQSTPDHVGIIAEIKKASPSKGDIRPDLDPALYAEYYTEGGARAISVLTEQHFFKGSLKDLETARKHSPLPILRKDFTISSYQIFEGKAAGADSILLITTLLAPDQLKDYIDLAREINLEPLVEIISEAEFEIAVKSGARCIGINNRNLQTLETDLDVSKRLAPLFFEGLIPVEASGIASRKDIDHGLESGFCNFLVGESIVRAEDTKAFIRELAGSSPPAAQKTVLQPLLKKEHSKPLIKICGLTDPDEALACARLGADAIGLVFFEKSPRNVVVKQASDICRALPEKIITTGVFVNASKSFIMERVKACNLKAVQLHGQESPNLVESLAKEGLIVIKALFAKTPPLLDEGSLYPFASGFIAEYGEGPLPGGNARAWNWEKVLSVNRAKPLILAGGLDPLNIGQVVHRIRPDAVDVSSGVERAPGKKDLDKVKAFIHAVKENRA